MPAKLHDLIVEAHKDRELFMDLLENTDKTLSRRNIALTDPEKATLREVMDRIHEYTRRELNEARVIAGGDRRAVISGIVGGAPSDPEWKGGPRPS